MNFNKLFAMQKELDTYIEEKHPRKENEDRVGKKILALLVELGELTNEWRGFKFWSVNPVPKEPKKVLEEYVDCLHFFLSIGIELGCKDYQYKDVNISPDGTSNFIYLFGLISSLSAAKSNLGVYRQSFNQFISLGTKHLGFTWEQIEQAYMEKNETNHKRQDSGY